MVTKYPKCWNEVIDGVSFPFTKFENGIIICDYPSYPHSVEKRISDINIEKIINIIKNAK